MADGFLRPNETMDEFLVRCTNLSAWDCSEAEMLWWRMGPVRLPLREALPISLALVGVFVSGVAGNACVCVVMARHPAMQASTTNYYLFSLALSDLLLLLAGLPHDLSLYWHQYPYSLGLAFCKFRALISEAIYQLSVPYAWCSIYSNSVPTVAVMPIFSSILQALYYRKSASYVSVLTIVAFSLERYLAICHPLQVFAVAGLRRALRVVAALWLVALAAAAPFAAYTTINYYDYPPGSGKPSLQSAFCAMLELPSWYLCELSSLIFFLLPAALILALYVRMGLRIRYVMGASHTHKPGSPGTLNGVIGSVHGEARQAQSRKTIIRMLAAVVIAFFVCWAPFHFQRLFYIYGGSSPYYHSINQHLFSVAGLLYYVSATVNPILYNVMSKRYRKAFKETLCCRGTGLKQRQSRSQWSVRESTVHHTSEGALVRLRSHAPRPHTDVARRGSFSETTTLCSPKWKQKFCSEKKRRGVLMKASSCSSNEVKQYSPQYRHKECCPQYHQVDTATDSDSNINIDISIRLHK